MHRIGRRFFAPLWTAACLLVSVAAGMPQTQPIKGQPLATRERVLSAGWWPTKSAPPREEYLGPAACAECHPSETTAQQTTPMAKAGVLAASSRFLAAHEHLELRLATTLMILRALRTIASSPSATARALFRPISGGHSAKEKSARPTYSCAKGFSTRDGLVTFRRSRPWISRQDNSVRHPRISTRHWAVR